MKEITEKLMALQDLKYRDFHSKLIPNVEKEKIIGIRLPAVKKFAAELAKQPALASAFMAELPHFYYDENTLHGALIGKMAKTPQQALDMIDEFLPYVDNWGVCDSLPAKILKKDLPMVRQRIIPWLDSGQVYRVRFAVVCMLSFMLDDAFEPDDLHRLCHIRTDEYYINMAIAWYYSFALIKQYDDAVRLFESKALTPWIHNKSIQKARESYRVSPERKEYLKTLKIKKGGSDGVHR